MDHKLILRRLVMAACLAGLILAPGLALAQGGGYDETFDTGAPGWKLDQGWSTGDGLLSGRDQGSAVYAGQTGWHDGQYKVVIRSLAGQADFTFMNTGHQWYQVLLISGAGTIEAQLHYTSLGQEFPPTLGDGVIKYSPALTNLSFITLEVDTSQRAVDVMLNGQKVIHYDAPQDEPAGTIGFDVYGNSAISVDEVAVNPTSQVTETPTAASSGEDLAITGLRLKGVRRGSVIADLTVDISNQGSADSQATTLVVYDQSQPNVRIQVSVEPLAAGSSRSINVSLEGPDDWANTARDFVALIDPNNTLGEADTDNNRFIASGIVLNVAAPPSPNGPTPVPNTSGGLPSSDPLPIILGGLGLLAVVAAGGTGLILRNQTTLRDRKALQKQAQPGQPPDHCTPPGRYMGVETELDLKLLKVTEIHVDLVDPRSLSTRRSEVIKDKVPGDLNAVIRGHWLHEPEDRLAERTAALAKGLSRDIEQVAYREKEALDVRVSAHLEGLELTSTFTLYTCRKQGVDGVWKKVASWEVKKQQQRDDTLFGLEQLDSQATSMAMRLEALITPLLQEYMKRF